MAEPARPVVRVSVVLSPRARVVQSVDLVLDAGSTLADALAAARDHIDVPEDSAGGIWGRKQPLSHMLREGDRIEVYRPLAVDPKLARRERFNRQGARSAGLFARKRPGAKAGY